MQEIGKEWKEGKDDNDKECIDSAQGLASIVFHHFDADHEDRRKRRLSSGIWRAHQEQKQYSYLDERWDWRKLVGYY